MDLVVRTRNSEEAIILYCSGRLVFKRGTDTLFHSIAELLQQGRHVVLHLHGVTAIDSAGLGCIVQLDAQARALGLTIRYCNLSRRVREMFALTNLATVLPVYETEEEALRDLGPVRASSYAMGA